MADHQKTALEIEGVTCQGRGPFTLTVPAGETVCLSGPSGVGKSLLLRAVADLEPHTGTVRWRGRDARTRPPTRWRRQVGYLPAESAWWSARVSDHFAAAETDELMAALALPAALLTAPVTELSTGERQRLALVRLLLNGPEVLLLDEPTASLDPASTACVEALVDEYRQRQEAPVLWVSHDPAQIARLGGRHLRLSPEGVEAAAA